MPIFGAMNEAPRNRLIGAMDERSGPQFKAVELTEFVRWNRPLQCDFFCLDFLTAKKVVLLKSGIGKGKSAVRLLCLLSQFQPEYVINIGFCWWPWCWLQLEDVVISDRSGFIMMWDCPTWLWLMWWGRFQTCCAVSANTDFSESGEKSLTDRDSSNKQSGLIGTG